MLECKDFFSTVRKVERVQFTVSNIFFVNIVYMQNTSSMLDIGII